MDSCSPIPNSKNVTLPDGCVTRGTNSSIVDVGECEPVACLRNDSTFNSSCQDPSLCCGPRDVQYVLVDCGEIMSFNLSKVTHCSCGGCTEKVTIVNGIVVGGSEEKPIRYGDVIYGGEVVEYTDEEGRFSLTIPQKVKRAIVTFQDFYQEFEERTKVFLLNEGSTAFHKIKLKRVPAPITFNTSEPTDIPLGSHPNDSFAELQLSEGSFLIEDGSVFQGNAKATIIVTDSRNLSEVLTAPGDFTTTDEEGEAEILETYGMVKLKFEDESGKPLAMSKPMKVYLDPEKLNLTVQNTSDIPLKLYWLEKKTERWREVGNFQLGDGSKRRRKRSNRVFFVGTVPPAIAQEWLNFDWPAERVAVRVTTDPPNGAGVVVRVIRQEGLSYRGYIEKTTSAEGLVCIPIWRNRTCHIQAESNGKYMSPITIDDLPLNIHARLGIDNANSDIQWILFESKLDETSNIPTPMYKHIPAEVAKCKSSQNRSEGSQFTFQAPKTVADFSILNNKNNDWVNGGCYIKIKVNGENAIFAAESYKESDTGETGKIGWHIRMSRTVTAGGSSIVCLQFSCPTHEAFTYLKVVPLTRQCTFRAIHADLLRVQHPSCPKEFRRPDVCPDRPPAIGGQAKWLWIPKNSAGQKFYRTFRNIKFGEFSCLAGDQSYKGSLPTTTTDHGYALEYDCR